MLQICWALALLPIHALALTVLGQESTFECKIESVLVTANGLPASEPFAGRAIESKPCLGDLDRDGDPDMLIGGFDGNIKRCS